MKKRILSVFLALVMLLLMIPTGIIPTSAAVGFACTDDGGLCDMFPHALRSLQYNDINYYIALHNIKHVYNAKALEESFDRSISRSIYDCIKEDGFSVGCLKLLHGIFGTDGELTEQDLFDSLIINMILDNTVNTCNNVDTVQNLVSTIDSFTSMTVSVLDDVAPGVIRTISLWQFLKSMGQSGWSTFLQTLKSQYSVQELSLYRITIGSKTVKMEGKYLDQILTQISNGKINLETIDQAFMLLQAGLDIFDEIDEYSNNLAKALLIWQNAGNGAKDFLEEMLDVLNEDSNALNINDTRKKYLKNAIKKYSDLIDSESDSILDLALFMLRNSTETLQEISINVIMTYFKSMVLSQSTIYKTGKIIFAFFDVVFDFSQKAEMVYIIECLNVIERVVVKAVSNIEKDILANWNNESSLPYCAAYIQGMLMAWRLQVSSNNYSKEYMETWFGEEKFNEIFEDDEAWDDWEGSIERLNDNLENYKPSTFLSTPIQWYNIIENVIARGFTIKFDLNGGKGEIAPMSKPYAEHAILPKTEPTREGYKFIGWSLPGYPDIIYKSGERIDSYIKDIGSSLEPCLCCDELKLKAVWEKGIFISYNANGGTGAPASHENTGNTLISSVVPTREGHKFLGWSENPNASDPSYVASDSNRNRITKTGNVTLYAIWEARPFDIVFHANGGTYADGGESVTKQKIYLQPFTINFEAPTKENAEFLGWSTSSTATTPTYNHAGVNGATTADATYNDIGGKGLSTKHLYAVWRKTAATFTYDYGDCTTAPPITIPLTNGSAQYTLVAPEAEKVTQMGRKFICWKYYYPDTSYVYYEIDDTMTITGDTIVYAEWENPSQNPILSVLTDKTSYMPGDTVKINITADNSGYFKVDTSNNSGFKIKCTNGTKASSGIFAENGTSADVDLKCYDNGSSYTVYLYLPSSCKDGVYYVDITVSNGTYNVSGTETGSITESVAVKVDTSEEETDSYTLLYHPNYGYGSIPDAVRFKEGEKVYLSDADGLYREGYNFSHWSTDEDGGGKEYKAGRSYKFTENVTLYAQWEVDSTADVSKELELILNTDRFSSKTGVHWYKPGDIIGLRIDIDNSNHFYVDATNCPNFTFTNARGNTATEGTFYERTSPNYDGNQTTYTNGSPTYVSIKIPNNCKDGEYTIFVTGADGVVDPTTGSSNGKKLPVGITITVRKSEAPDEVQLNVSEITLHEGKKKALEASIIPAFVSESYLSTNKKYITWTSSNSSIASVSKKTGTDIRVIGENVGSATITATFNGVSATCKVNVVDCDYCIKEIDSDYLASAATCTSPAKYYYVCSCGDVSSKTYSYGSPSDHSFSDWVIITEPGEYSAGIKQRKCTYCDHFENIALPATGHIKHEPGAQWFIDDSYHWQECTCSEIMNKAEHSDGNNDNICDVCSANLKAETKTYTITYNANGGSGAPAAQTKTEGVNITLSTVKPTRSGYTFKGWATSASGSVAYGRGAVYKADASVTLYAVWEKDPVEEGVYTVTFDARGGSVTPESIQVKYGEKYGTLPKPTKEGHTFIGWYTALTSGKHIYSSTVFEQNSNQTLYAHWSTDKYTVTYNANGGSGAPAAENVFYGSDLTVSSTVPTRYGFTFKGWSTSQNASYFEYEAGETITVKNNMVLYAVWLADYDLIKLNVSSAEARRGQTVDIKFELEQSNFIGAYVGNVEYDSTILTPVGISYEHGYENQGQSNIEDPSFDPSKGFFTLFMLDTQDPLGYAVVTFKISDKAAAGKEQLEVKITQCIDCFKEEYSTEVVGGMISIIDNYTVTYNANGGSGAPAAQTKIHGEALTLSTAKPIRSGYTFKGWATSASGSVVYGRGAVYKADASVTLYAIWEKNSVPVTGVSLNKTSATLTSGGVLALSATVSPSNATDKTVTWSSSNTSVATVTSGGVVTARSAGTATITATTFDGNKTAVCTVTVNAKTFTINYNATGGKGAPAAQTKTEGVNITLSTSKPTRSGYTFKGWATSANGPVLYGRGAVYKADESVTLYAVWEINTYTITYNANGGKDTPAEQEKLHGVSIKLSTEKPTRSGHTFRGWATSAGGNVAYDSGADFSLNQNVTLYAVWEANEYTVSYNANGGKGAPSAQSKTHGINITLSTAKPTRNGYAFKGWATSADGNVAYGRGSVYKVDSNVTLYAVWEQVGSFIPGDANEDADIDTKDAVLLAQHLAEWKVDVNLGGADCNGDGKIDTKDAVLLAQYLADWKVSLG